MDLEQEEPILKMLIMGMVDLFQYQGFIFLKKTNANAIVRCNSLCDLHSPSTVVKMIRLKLQVEMLFVALPPIFSQ